MNRYFTKYKAGEYGFKNGIKIVKTNRNIWTAYSCAGAVIGTFATLRDAKHYLYHKYCR